jgi:hypothetical protein
MVRQTHDRLSGYFGRFSTMSLATGMAEKTLGQPT